METLHSDLGCELSIDAVKALEDQYATATPKIWTDALMRLETAEAREEERLLQYGSLFNHINVGNIEWGPAAAFSHPVRLFFDYIILALGDLERTPMTKSDEKFLRLKPFLGEEYDEHLRNLGRLFTKRSDLRPTELTHIPYPVEGEFEEAFGLKKYFILAEQSPRFQRVTPGEERNVFEETLGYYNHVLFAIDRGDFKKRIKEAPNPAKYAANIWEDAKRRYPLVHPDFYFETLWGILPFLNQGDRRKILKEHLTSFFNEVPNGTSLSQFALFEVNGAFLPLITEVLNENRPLRNHLVQIVREGRSHDAAYALHLLSMCAWDAKCPEATQKIRVQEFVSGIFSNREELSDSFASVKLRLILIKADNKEKALEVVIHSLLTLPYVWEWIITNQPDWSNQESINSFIKELTKKFPVFAEFEEGVLKKALNALTEINNPSSDVKNWMHGVKIPREFDIEAVFEEIKRGKSFAPPERRRVKGVKEMEFPGLMVYLEPHPLSSDIGDWRLSFEFLTKNKTEKTARVILVVDFENGKLSKCRTALTAGQRTQLEKIGLLVARSVFVRDAVESVGASTKAKVEETTKPEAQEPADKEATLAPRTSKGFTIDVRLKDQEDLDKKKSNVGVHIRESETELLKLTRAEEADLKKVLVFRKEEMDGRDLYFPCDEKEVQSMVEAGTLWEDELYVLETPYYVKACGFRAYEKNTGLWTVTAVKRSETAEFAYEVFKDGGLPELAPLQENRVSHLGVMVNEANRGEDIKFVRVEGEQEPLHMQVVNSGPLSQLVQTVQDPTWQESWVRAQASQLDPDLTPDQLETELNSIRRNIERAARESYSVPRDAHVMDVRLALAQPFKSEMTFNQGTFVSLKDWKAAVDSRKVDTKSDTGVV